MKIYIQHRAKNNVCDLGEDVLSVRCVLRPVKRYFWPLNFKHGLTNGRQKTETKPHVAEHHEQIKHNVDWDSAECITYCTITTNNARNITLESWYTTGTTKPIKTTTGTLQKTYSQHGPNKETITLLTNHAYLIVESVSFAGCISHKSLENNWNYKFKGCIQIHPFNL